jgi:predicted O-methyltransferase YrrM
MKYIIFWALLVSVFVGYDLWCLDQSMLPEPYRSINILPFDPHGWLSPINQVMLDEFSRQEQKNKKPRRYLLEFLHEVTRAKKPKIVVELGAWLGKSTVLIASNVPEGSKVYAVDHWFGSLEHQGRSDVDVKLKILFQQFLSNVIHKGMAHIIVPIRMNTLEAAVALNVQADLIYVDASHEENDVYNDIIAWHKKLISGGIMCGDDYMWGKAKDYPVKRAVDRAATALGKVVVVNGNWFWYFE